VTSAEKAARSEEARYLLKNGLLVEVFEDAERRSFEDALKAGTDQERREHLDMVRAVRRLRGLLEAIHMDGVAAQRPRGAVA
jgi:hypothetical protein